MPMPPTRHIVEAASVPVRPLIGCPRLWRTKAR